MAGGSNLLFDEYWEREDARFLGELLACESDKKLKSFATKLFEDQRPFARRMLLAYVDDGCDRPHHRPLVKALYKLAEKSGDDEVLARFMVAFDRFAGRILVEQPSYDWSTRETVTRYVWRHRPEIPTRAAGKDVRRYRNPQTGEDVEVPAGKDFNRFSVRTRQYLARRVLRWLRTISRRDQARFRRVACRALALYRDEDLSTPDQLLGAWSLLHIMYRGSRVLDRRARGVRVAEGAQLKELTFAPMQPEAWHKSHVELLDLVVSARSQPARRFALAMLRDHHGAALQSLPLDGIRRLLATDDEDVQVFGAELLKSYSGLANVKLDEWLGLLAVRSITAVTTICELVTRHVSPDRRTLERCCDLARAPAAPVAELGVAWAKGKPVRSLDELMLVLRLADAPVHSVRDKVCAWTAELLQAIPGAGPEHVRELLDARFADVRSNAMQAVEKDAKLRDDTMLWAAMSESPYDDVRAKLVTGLEEREKLFTPDSLRHVWATTLLAVHRGSRPKPAVVKQLAGRIAKRPDEAAALVPLLRISLRSVRATERKSAIAALARLAFDEPTVREEIARQIPELKLFPLEAP